MKKLLKISLLAAVAIGILPASTNAIDFNPKNWLKELATGDKSKLCKKGSIFKKKVSPCRSLEGETLRVLEEAANRAVKGTGKTIAGTAYLVCAIRCGDDKKGYDGFNSSHFAKKGKKFGLPAPDERDALKKALREKEKEIEEYAKSKNSTLGTFSQLLRPALELALKKAN